VCGVPGAVKVGIKASGIKSRNARAIDAFSFRARSESEAIDIDHSLGERHGRFLRQVVSDTASQRLVLVLAGEP
jgi:hypothetical protein